MTYTYKKRANIKTLCQQKGPYIILEEWAVIGTALSLWIIHAYIITIDLKKYTPLCTKINCFLGLYFNTRHDFSEMLNVLTIQTNTLKRKSSIINSITRSA
jgi:hypothetical protein